MKLYICLIVKVGCLIYQCLEFFVNWTMNPSDNFPNKYKNDYTKGISTSNKNYVFLFFWQEMLGFALPLVNYQYFRKKFLQVISKPSMSATESVSFSTKSQCSFCNETPILPVHIGCSHAFCYYCLEVSWYPRKVPLLISKRLMKIHSLKEAIHPHYAWLIFIVILWWYLSGIMVRSLL